MLVQMQCLLQSRRRRSRSGCDANPLRPTTKPLRRMARPCPLHQLIEERAAEGPSINVAGQLSYIHPLPELAIAPIVGSGAAGPRNSPIS